MNSTAAVLLVLACILLVGIGSLAYRHRALSSKRGFTAEFITRLGRFARAELFDGEQYTWLMERSLQMQEDLGSLGVVQYKPPGSLTFIPGYQVILNLLPELRRLRTGEYRFAAEETFREQASLCLDTLVRYSGDLDRRHGQSAAQLRNPLVWLREGVQAILLLPISLLVALGVLGASTENGLRGSATFRVAAGIVTLVGLAGGVITIVIGWTEFATIVGDLFNRILPR